MGQLQDSLAYSSQAVSTGAQQLLSKTVSGIAGAGRAGFLPPHLHDALGASVPTDPRFSSTSALDMPFRPVQSAPSATLCAAPCPACHI